MDMDVEISDVEGIDGSMTLRQDFTQDLLPLNTEGQQQQQPDYLMYCITPIDAYAEIIPQLEGYFTPFDDGGYIWSVCGHSQMSSIMLPAWFQTSFFGLPAPPVEATPLAVENWKFSWVPDGDTLAFTYELAPVDWTGFVGFKVFVRVCGPMVETVMEEGFLEWEVDDLLDQGWGEEGVPICDLAPVDWSGDGMPGFDLEPVDWSREGAPEEPSVAWAELVDWCAPGIPF